MRFSVVRAILIVLIGFMASVSNLAFSAQAPQFVLPTAKGTPVSLASLRGKVVYVDFWASWCGPCRKSFPWMSEMQTRYGEKFKVVAINLDENRNDAYKFITEIKPNFTIVFDPKGTSAESYKVIGMPSSYLIDKNGKLVDSFVGYRFEDKAMVEKKINALLAQ
ncbi:MAG: TlpA family protein disulfide reductase [Gammaproteobacteria bacterium]|nr:TlpA family protein disulfide reductase [Gammaproteobacteria bacterium]